MPSRQDSATIWEQSGSMLKKSKSTSQTITNSLKVDQKYHENNKSVSNTSNKQSQSHSRSRTNFTMTLATPLWGFCKPQSSTPTHRLSSRGPKKYCLLLFTTAARYLPRKCRLVSFLSASLYFSKRGAYWDRLCRDVVGRWLVVTRVHCGQTVHPRPIVTMEH